MSLQDHLLVLPPTCHHPVNPELYASLAAHGIAVCPTCLIRHHVFECATTQAMWKRRGGVYASWSLSRAEKGTRKLGERSAHSALVKYWRLLKIDLYGDVHLLEQLRIKHADAPWKVQLDRALEFWEEMEQVCSQLPGYDDPKVDTYVYEESTMNDECDSDLKGHFSQGTTDDKREVVESLREVWHTIKPRALGARRRRRLSLSTPANLPSTSNPERVQLQTRTPCSTDTSSQRPNNLALSQTDHEPTCTGPKVHGDNQKECVLLPEAADDLSLSNSPKAYVPTSPSEFPPSPIRNTVRPQITAARPSLKRKSVDAHTEEPQVRKKVRIADKTTIILDANACDPLRFLYKRPHARHTTAEHATKRRLLKRCRSYAHPLRSWMAPKGWEYINTSHAKTPWDVYVEMQQRSDIEEENGKI